MRRARGSVVVVVVWSVAIAAVMVAATQIVSYRQAVVGRESLARVEARWAARAGLEQMISLMEFEAASPNPDDPLAIVRDMEAMALGETATGSWSISHFNDGVEWAGPRDEGAKLNINVATRAQLANIPGMSPDVVDAIVDWRDTNDNVEGLGAESDYYTNRSMGYRPRNGPFRSLAELELVAGCWPKYVRGEDWNLNGRLDPNEDDGPRSFPDDKPDGRLDAGWSQYLTAVSRQSPMSLSGNEKFRLGGADPDTLMKATGVDDAQAKALIAWAGQGSNRPEMLLGTPLSQLASGQSGQASNARGGGNSRGGGGGGGGGGAASLGTGAESGGARAGGSARGAGGGGGGGAPAGGQQATSGRSSGGRGAAGTDGRSAVRDLDAAQLRGILREASNDNFAQRVPGRININTAPAALLKEVMQIDPRVADAIVARRNSSPRGIASIADLQGMSGLTPALLTQIAQQFDVTSSVYTVTSRGRSASTGAEVEIEAVVDRSTYPATIVSYRER
jgi:DNA uptake protein ComE-like DNA-binding protein